MIDHIDPMGCNVLHLPKSAETREQAQGAGVKGFDIGRSPTSSPQPFAGTMSTATHDGHRADIKSDAR
jgi:hypothetical protein